LQPLLLYGDDRGHLGCRKRHRERGLAGSFGKLFDSGYGDVLLKKLAVVAAMLAVAYFNRFIATPRLRAASSKEMRQITWLRYSVAFDVVLGALVLGASAILGITMPPQ
jgi:copper resistance protein D